MPPAASPWFSRGGGEFAGGEPNYFEPADFAWTARIEAQWRTIRDELLALLEQQRISMMSYPNGELTADPAHWKTFALLFWSHRLEHNMRQCPRTWQLLKDIPHLSSASFSLLEPQAAIHPHRGDTNAIMRCHLGLVIPAPAPACAFQVEDEMRGWENGRFLLFCDAHVHAAWNHTAGQRYILILDVMRPAFATRQRAVSRRVLAAILSEMLAQRLAGPGKGHARRAVRALLYGVLHASWLTRRLLDKYSGRT